MPLPAAASAGTAADGAQTITVTLGTNADGTANTAASASDVATLLSGALGGHTVTTTSTATDVGEFSTSGTASGGVSEVLTTAVSDLSITSLTGAQSAIESIDLALSDIDTIRGGLGAVQNRFESTIANLNNVSENLSAARSRILDADIAQETSAMTKNNILQQAGVSILAQANQTPQLALSLLG